MSKPKKPFMIERGNDLATIRPGKDGAPRVRWHGWDGSKYATKAEAESAVAAAGLTGVTIIEVLDETRWRSGGR